ncbi:phage tail length tape measure family protein [Enterobacter asburiae]|uniref:phage tail length tape measure family protein n=1 Tax=Enterobacter asburiae TaxID=61645 RepID=UPI00192C86B6|nr:phage tail length tape measure family protein [Enterobacter asburiae]MBL5924951.1 phage tail length tape measure family protein [Enterobacter asburiae]MBL5955738.1 phage tail length tape measure family protein [Enterobacter asburiae]
MSENVGTIEYTVKSDTAQLLTGGQEVTKVTGQMEKAFDNVDKSAQSMNSSLTKTAQSVNKATTSMGGGKQQMQAFGYQLQDLIVQLQSGTSFFVAFGQQGSQLAGAFGPGGAVFGAIIALSSVIGGVLVASLGNGKSAMEALTDAAEAMDKVITLSQSGVAALSDKYANLARTNAEAATILRNQALIEYNQAIAQIPKAIDDASTSILSFSDKAISAFTGGYASIDGFNDRLKSLDITTDDYSKAMQQAGAAGQAFQATTNSIGNTVGALASKFGITEQQAYALAKQLSDIAQNPTPEALQKLTLELQSTTSSTDSGTKALAEFTSKLTDVVATSADAKARILALRGAMDNLTESQKNLVRQSERQLQLAQATGKERAKLQAQYAAEDAGLSKDDPTTKKLENNAAAAYDAVEAQKAKEKADRKSLSTGQKQATQQESINQKLEQLRQKSELAATSTQEMSREQAVLNAQQSLGKNASEEQIRLAGEYAAKTWDATNALKARQQAEQGQKFAKQEIAQTQSTADPLTGEVANPTAAIDLQEQQKLATVAKYQALDVQNTQLYEDAKTAIQARASAEREKILLDESNKQAMQTSQLIGIAASSFDSLASVIAASGGKTSAAYKAIFAISKGFSIAQASLNMMTAVSNALALPFPANIPAMASAAAAGAQIASTISGISYSGGRRYGGTTSSGNMYRVNESGEPEMFQSSGGKQYMMPTTSGKVVPASDVGGGNSAPVMNVIVENYASGTTVQNQGYDQTRQAVVIAVREVAKQIRTGTGDVSRAMRDTWNVTSKSQ